MHKRLEIGKSKYKLLHWQNSHSEKKYKTNAAGRNAQTNRKHRLCNRSHEDFPPPKKMFILCLQG